MEAAGNLRKKIIDHLYWDSTVDASNIEVTVSNPSGIVTLEGSVNNFVGKILATDIVQKIPGVTAVNNNLNVIFSKDAKAVKDKDLKDNIKHIFLTSLYDSLSLVKVDVENGLVTLSGNVPKLWLKSKAFKLVSEMKGVKDILNKIVVLPTTKIVDRMISEDIASAITRKLGILADSIFVKVDEGIVVLQGSLPAIAGKKTILSAVENTEGVIAIEDNLIIDFDRNC